jgi:uncharacterized membrane protein YqaE (UPF0057 family)
LQDITNPLHQPLSTHLYNYNPPTPKKQHTITMPFTASDLCKILLAFFLPPLGVFLERGCNADFFINILLTILGYIPVSPTSLRTADVVTNKTRVSSTLCTSFLNFNGGAPRNHVSANAS